MLKNRERHCKAGQKQSGGLFLASLQAAMLRRVQHDIIQLQEMQK